MEEIEIDLFERRIEQNASIASINSFHLKLNIVIIEQINQVLGREFLIGLFLYNIIA
jgi:hypothetical protein